MNEELVQDIRGNTDDIQKDSATLVLLQDRIPAEFRHLPIATVAGIEVIRDFKAFNETTSYNATTKKFSGVGLNMCLPWADGAAKTKLADITSHIQLTEAFQVLQQVLEGVWQKQSHTIFGPWFSDLREEFVSTTFTGFRSLPLKLQLMTSQKWVANMISSFTLMRLCHLSMEGFNDAVRKSIKINVQELHAEIHTAMNIVTSQQSISSIGLSESTVGYALAKGLSIDVKQVGVGGGGSSTNATDPDSTALGKRKGKKPKLAADQEDNPQLKKLKEQVASLEQQVKKAAAGTKRSVMITAPPPPAGNASTAPRTGVCISHIAHLLGINATDCPLGYPNCGRPHIDMEPITPVFKATLRGYVSNFRRGPFRTQLDEKIAALA